MNGDPLLLDTCAMLWLASGSPRLSPSGRETIGNAKELLFSPISAWEVAQLVCHAHGRLHSLFAMVSWPSHCHR